MDRSQQGFRSAAKFGFGGQESASKPPQAICKPLAAIKKMRILLAFGLCLIIFFSSCSVQEPLTNSPFSQQTFPDTIGIFSNRVDSATWEGSSLWSQLVFRHETDTSAWRHAEVELILLSEEALKAEYILDGEKLDCVILKGDLKENEFVLKTQHKYYPLIIVVAAYGQSNTRIALKDSLLLTENRRTGVLLLGSVMPIFGAGGAPSTYLYKRK